MTRLSLADCHTQMGNSVAVWGGICSVSVLTGSFTDAQFEDHINSALDAFPDGRGIVYSIADTTPPDASLDRIRRIGEVIGARQLTRGNQP